MSHSKISMRDVTKRAREVLSPKHSAHRLVWPAGVEVRSKYGGTPCFLVRSGNHEAAKRLAIEFLNTIERMQKERGDD